MRLLLGLHIFILLFTGIKLNAQADFTASANKGCIPFDVKFAIDTSSIDITTVTVAEWDFGNGETVTANAEDTVTATFTEKRLYSVKLTINNDEANAVSRSGFIRGLDPLISDFDIVKDEDQPDYTYSFYPTIEISDTSADYNFVWEHFSDDGTSLRRIAYLVDASNSEEAIEQYTYADTGLYRVSLTLRQLKDEYNCESVTIKDLLISEEFIVGNVFSPLTTDYFIIDPENNAITLNFQLFTRTGVKVFEQKAPRIYWDGRNNSGLELGTGVYFYVIEAASGDPDGFYTKKGFIHLYR